MLYDDKFIASLAQNPVAGARQACEIAIAAVRMVVSEKDAEVLDEAETLLDEMMAAGLLQVSFSVPKDSPSRLDRAKLILDALKDVVAQCRIVERQERIQSFRSRFQIGLGTRFSYEFSQADIDRVQALLNELRTLIASAIGFAPDHQQRLLSRLETLQRELHKKVADLDRFWGLIGDAGVVLAKLGNDAKPIVDRIREIADIVWNTQGRAEELPSSSKPPQIGYESLPPSTDA